MENTLISSAQRSSGATAAQPLYRRLLLSRHLKQHALLVAANLLAGLCGYLLHSVLGHLAGPAAYGAFAALVALSSVLLIPVQIISTVVAKRGAELSAAGDMARLNDLIRRLTFILLPIGIGAAVILVAASGYISDFLRLNSPREAIIMALMFVFSFAAPVNVGAIQGLQRFTWYGGLLVLPVLFRLMLASVFVMLGFGVDGAVLGMALASLLSYLISFQPIRPILNGPRLTYGSLRPLWRDAITTTIAFVSTGLLYNLDTLLAKHFLSAREAGLYAALATTGNIVLVAGSGVLMAAFPKFVNLHRRGERLTKSVLMALLNVLLLSLAVELALDAAPMYMIRVFVGPSFIAIAGQLCWYGFAMLLLSVALVFIYYFLSIGNRMFVLPLLAACGAQGVLFGFRHQTVDQLVQAVLMTNGVLIVVLCALFLICLRRTPLRAGE